MRTMLFNGGAGENDDWTACDHFVHVARDKRLPFNDGISDHVGSSREIVLDLVIGAT
jgi:hypothetical protein